MKNFRVIIIGLGIQGEKRRNIAGLDVVSIVDPYKKEANFKNTTQVPLNSFDAALICTPDESKIEIINYLIKNKKHILVEKPLWAANVSQLIKVKELAKENNVVCYTAYNHRFEPHFIKMKKLLKSGKLGNIYSCRIFYGNGTAALVKSSDWRDKGSGVLPDLGSHLLDLCLYWFDISKNNFKLISANTFENKSYDHIVISNESSKPRIELEMTLLMWRNHFTCDIIAEKGSAHIQSLCKWGPSNFIYRKRILPSGRPIEEISTLIKNDPTWDAEYIYFKNLCNNYNKIDEINYLDKDIWLQKTLNEISSEVINK
jgi:predicted dehydrogenase